MITVREYCDILNIEIVCRYYPNQGGRWSAHFDGAEFKASPDDSVLTSPYGSGGSASDALGDYLDRICGKWLVLHAANSERRVEYRVPEGIVP